MKTRTYLCIAAIAVSTLFVACSTSTGSSDDPAPTTTPDTTTPATNTPGTTTPDTTTPGTTTPDTTTPDTTTPDTTTPGTTTPGTTTPTTPKPALTLTDIVGEWSCASSDETSKTTTKITISADGKFELLDISEGISGSDPERAEATAARASAEGGEAVTVPVTVPKAKCTAEKGTVSLGDDGMTLSFTITHTCDVVDPRDPTSITWVAKKAPSSKSYYVCMIDGKLYTNVYKRQGSGTGIKGTWVSITGDSAKKIPYRKTEIIFGDTPGTKAAENNFYIGDGTNWTLNDTGTYDSYEISSGFILLKSGEDVEKQPIVMKDDYIAVGSGFSKI